MNQGVALNQKTLELCKRLEQYTIKAKNQMIEYEKEDETMKQKTLTERTHLVNQHLYAFRDLIRACPTVLSTIPSDEKKLLKEPKYLFFTIDLNRFIRVLKQEEETLDHIIYKEGSFLPSALFHHVTEDCFKSFIEERLSKNLPTCLIGCAEVVLTTADDVKRIYFDIQGEDKRYLDFTPDDLSNAMSPFFTKTKEEEETRPLEVTNEMMDFLHNPRAHPQALETVLDELKQLNPEMAFFAKKHLGSAPSPPVECAKCKIKDIKLFHCGRCLAIYYCSKECQNVHWKEQHKALCIRKR